MKYYSILNVFYVVMLIAAACFFLHRVYSSRLDRAEKQAEYYKTMAETPRFVERTVRDTVTVVQQKIVEVDRRDYKKLTANADVLRELGSKTSLVLAESEMSKTFSDTVRPAVQDSLIRYTDAWVEISYRPLDSLFTYSVRDSINVLITKRYKHHFWFIRWGRKSYDVSIVNFNPRSRITHFSTVAVE